MSYRVLVDDNFHYMDENYRRNLGEFPTYSEALAVCREVVDRFMGHEYVPGMAESALYFRYMMFGKDPSIVEYSEPPDTSPGFSAWDYAKARCEELCLRPAEKTDQHINRRPEIEGALSPSS